MLTVHFSQKLEFGKYYDRVSMGCIYQLLSDIIENIRNTSQRKWKDFKNYRRWLDKREDTFMTKSSTRKLSIQ